MQGSYSRVQIPGRTDHEFERLKGDGKHIMNYRDLPKSAYEAVRDEFKATGRAHCPVCNSFMQMNRNEKSKPARPELYCETDHLSIPLWT